MPDGPDSVLDVAPKTDVLPVMVLDMAGGCDTVAEATAVQLCASETVTLYVPIDRLPGFAPVAPPLQAYE